MSADEEKQSALVPVQTTALTKAGAKSLAARGRNHLRDKQEAEEWLRKGLELQNAGPEAFLLPVPNTTLEYIKQILAGALPDVAAKNLDMTREDQESAKEAHKYMPGSLAQVEQENELRESLLKKFEENQQEAFRCFEKGHELDPMNAELSYWLAQNYYYGDGVDQDKEKAVPLYRYAAEQGHSKAQHRYSDCCREGEFVAQDHTQALKWLRKAAEQGDMGAQYDLALTFKYGNLGVQQDTAQAAIWFRKVANQADRKARI
jgi:hypothetical protein